MVNSRLWSVVSFLGQMTRFTGKIGNMTFSVEKKSDIATLGQVYQVHPFSPLITILPAFNFHLLSQALAITTLQVASSKISVNRLVRGAFKF